MWPHFGRHSCFIQHIAPRKIKERKNKHHQEINTPKTKQNRNAHRKLLRGAKPSAGFLSHSKLGIFDSLGKQKLKLITMESDLAFLKQALEWNSSHMKGSRDAAATAERLQLIEHCNLRRRMQDKELGRGDSKSPATV